MMEPLDKPTSPPGDWKKDLLADKLVTSRNIIYFLGGVSIISGAYYLSLGIITTGLLSLLFGTGYLCCAFFLLRSPVILLGSALGLYSLATALQLAASGISLLGIVFKIMLIGAIVYGIVNAVAYERYRQ